MAQTSARRFQFHLLTIIIGSVAAGGFIYLNTVQHDGLAFESEAETPDSLSNITDWLTHDHGWPNIFIKFTKFQARPIMFFGSHSFSIL